MQTIAANVEQVRAEIAAACSAVGRDPAAVRLIAVTKSVGSEALPVLAREGIHDYGENRIDHLAAMAAGAPDGARFHHIGRIQSRQITDIVAHAACIHGLAQADHAHLLAKACTGRRLPVFIQVNVSGEASKAGVTAAMLAPLLDTVRALPTLEAVGLMTMAPPAGEGVDDDAIMACFSGLRDLARTQGLPRLSMGMSGDFALAIRAGATDVRIGARLFA